ASCHTTQRTSIFFHLAVANRIGIEQCQQAHFLARALKLRGHLESNHPSQRTAADKIGTLRLKLADLLDVVSGHLCNARMRLLLAIEATRLQSIKRLVRT